MLALLGAEPLTIDQIKHKANQIGWTNLRYATLQRALDRLAWAGHVYITDEGYERAWITL